MGVKLKWKVSPEPTGQYRSFQQRSWPSAEYPGKDDKYAQHAGSLSSVDSYTGRDSKRKDLDLRVWVADYRDLEASFTNRRLKATAKSVKEGKAMLVAFLDAHPEFQPKEKS